MLRSVSAVFAMMVSAAAAQAAIDCRIRSLPPAYYAAKPFPAVEYRGLPLAELQRLYRRFAGLPPRAAGISYCADPIGFVYPWRKGAVPTIYFPTDVSDRCRREVLAHEGAHVKGWPLDHPNGRAQVGECSRRKR